jgi:hypothetical protein
MSHLICLWPVGRVTERQKRPVWTDRISVEEPGKITAAPAI